MTNLLFEPPFRGLRGNVYTSSIARWKRVVDFLFGLIALFCWLLQLRRYKQIVVEVGTFQRGVGHLER